MKWNSHKKRSRNRVAEAMEAAPATVKIAEAT